jgi:hypothetical protein
MSTFKTSRIEVACTECGRMVLKWASQLKRAKHGAFCDRHCLGRFRSKKLTGDWAANFQNGSQREREYITVLAPWHPTGAKRVYLHRIIAEARLGRFLKPGEVVHHKDHDHSNNHWENLEVMGQDEHARIHIEKRERKANGRI